MKSNEYDMRRERRFSQIYAEIDMVATRGSRGYIVGALFFFYVGDKIFFVILKLHINKTEC